MTNVAIRGQEVLDMMQTIPMEGRGHTKRTKRKAGGADKKMMVWYAVSEDVKMGRREHASIAINHDKQE